MRGARAVLCGAVACALTCAGAHAQLCNPNFNANINYWSLNGAGSLTFEAGQGAPAPGAVLIENDDTSAPSTVVAMSQCRPATAGVAYYGGVKLLFPVAESSTGNTYVQLAFNAGSNCDAGMTGIHSSVALDPATSPRGVWLDAAVGSVDAGVVAGATTQTVRVSVVVVKPEMTATRSIEADSIVFFPQSTPFRDGFECGTTDSWSQVLP